MKKQISTGKIFAFCLGDFARAVINGLIITYSLKFFNVTESSGLPLLLAIGSFGAIRAGGMVFDAITDPWVASMSDRSTNKNGKRIPFMRWAAIPYALTCLMIFFPPNGTPTALNIIWVCAMMLLYYLASTLYCIPYQALQAELTTDTKRRVFFYSIQSFNFVIGSAIIYAHPFLVGMFKTQGFETVTAWRLTFAVFAALGAICAIIPSFTLREKEYVESQQSYSPILKSFSTTLKNKHFRTVLFGYLVMQGGFAFFNTAMLFYIDVLLGLKDTFATIVLAISIVLGISTYPLVNRLNRKFGKKPLLIFACIAYIFVYVGIFFYKPISTLLGTAVVTSPLIVGFAGDTATVGSVICAFLIGILIAFPIACTNILPHAAFADLAQYDRILTGENKTGMYVAARQFAYKASNALVMFVVSAVMYVGATNDYPTVFGVRLTALIAAGFVAIAAVLYIRYNDRYVVDFIDEHNAKQKLTQSETAAE